MSVLEYIVLSLALTIPTLVMVCDGARKESIRLTRGLGVSFVVAMEHVLFLLMGLLLGNFLSASGTAEYNDMVYLGIMVLVAVWMLFPLFRRRSQEMPSYDLSRWVAVLLLGVASGMRGLMVGLALGFKWPFESELWKAAIPLFLLMSAGCYLGIMLGRRKKSFHARRWQLIAVLFLLVFAFKGAFWGD